MHCFLLVVVSALYGVLDIPPGVLTSGDHLRSRLPAFVNCMAGAGELPSSPGPETTTDCLIEFDHDQDGDVDLLNYSQALNGQVESDLWVTGAGGGDWTFRSRPFRLGSLTTMAWPAPHSPEKSCSKASHWTRT